MIQKIKADIKRLCNNIDKCISELIAARLENNNVKIANIHHKMETLMVNIEQTCSYIIDSLEEEPVSKFDSCIQEGDKIVTNEDGTRFNISQLERVAKEYAKEVDFAGNVTIIGNEVDAFKAGANWQKQQDSISMSDDLEDEIEKYYVNSPKEFGQVLFEDFHIMASYFAQWGKKRAEVEIQAQSMAIAHGCPKCEKTKVAEKAEEIAVKWRAKGVPYKAIFNAAIEIANWQKGQFEKNRLAACDRQTEEDAEIERDFAINIIENEHRQPTFDDAIKYGMKLKEEQMMKDAIGAEVNYYENHLLFFPTAIYQLIEKNGWQRGDRVKVIIIKEK